MWELRRTVLVEHHEELLLLVVVERRAGKEFSQLRHGDGPTIIHVDCARECTYAVRLWSTAAEGKEWSVYVRVRRRERSALRLKMTSGDDQSL